MEDITKILFQKTCFASSGSFVDAVIYSEANKLNLDLGMHRKPQYSLPDKNSLLFPSGHRNNHKTVVLLKTLVAINALTALQAVAAYSRNKSGKG